MKTPYILLLFLFLAFVGESQSITTMQPAVSLDTNAVCAGSAVDVPFNSTGTFNVYNIYYLELSDSSGSFTNCDTIGQLYSNQSYPTSPGIAMGILPVSALKGCHYNIRVVSSDPVTIGSTWGSFCIQHCDIFTNSLQFVQSCVQSCYKNPSGYTDTIKYSVHNYDSLAHYAGNNKFEIQLLDYYTFNAVNTGNFGQVTDTINGKILLHVPCADSLTNVYGVPPGVYYMRVIAINSNFPDSSLGTLVHLTIGEPSDSIVLTSTMDSVCGSNLVVIYANPQHSTSPYNSSYTWWDSTYSFGKSIIGVDYDSLGITIFDTGTNTFICQENNYGCLGYPAWKKIYVEPCINSYNEPICIVTIDTANNKCKVIWGRTNSPPQNGFGYYNIYKDTIPGYGLVHSQALDSLSDYVDTASNPSLGPVSYELSTIDSIGESALSPPHTTIFLTTTSALNVFILNWTAYIGFTPTLYRIFRGPALNAMVQIDSVPNTVLTYRDTLPPLGSYYGVEAISPSGVCIPTHHSHNLQSTSISGSFSNGFNTAWLGVPNNYGTQINVKVFPNPSSGIFTIQSSVVSNQWSVEVYNEVGQCVYFNYQITKLSNHQINLSNQPNGVYTLRLQTENGIEMKKVVLMH